MSVDGTDFRVRGKLLPNGQPDKRLCSYKFKGPALRYEVGMCIRTSDIVWINGPFLPGVYNDLAMFWSEGGLRDQLEDDERVEADDGYIGNCPHHCKCPKLMAHREDQKRMKARLRMRHETVNERFKNFNCLQDRFRHPLEKHGNFFRAVAVLTQLAMSGGEELFDCREYDDRLSDQQVAALYGL